MSSLYFCFAIAVISQADAKGSVRAPQPATDVEMAEETVRLAVDD